MPKVYRAVPGDEEQSRSSSDTVYEEKESSGAIRIQSDNFERDPRTRVLDFLAKNWMWIAHTLLLSTSLVLFTLSFCQRTARISDLQVTEQYSSYCMLFPIRHSMSVNRTTNRHSTGGPYREIRDGEV